MSTSTAHRGTRSTAARRVAGIAAVIGVPVFLVGTALHQPRDGEGIAVVGERYGLTHSIQAIGLLLLSVALANLLAAGRERGNRWAPSVNLALVGTLAWFGLIVYDGAHNPATAQHAPELVHTPGSLDIGAAIIVVPALILFPLGYALFASTLAREGRRRHGLLLGAGAVIYTIGGALIFPLGPLSPLVQPLEVAGALALAVGYVLVGLAWIASEEDG